jgi:uncharacterized membrane protein YecN with MAPEG domain
LLTPHTALYAALLSLMYGALALRVVRLRYRLHVNLGDAGDVRLQRAVRTHAHFAEYVPLLLLLMLLMEVNGTPAGGLHTFGLLLLASRVLHTVGVGAEPENLRWRMASMVCTCSLLSGAAWSLTGAWLARA